MPSEAQVLEALEAARAETQAALILITHDLGVIAQVHLLQFRAT